MSQVASCTNPSPFEDPPASCPGDPQATPVCLSPDQLIPPVAPAVAPGEPPIAVIPPGCSNVTQTFFHQLFYGETEDGAIARQQETLDRMSEAAGGKPVQVVEWRVVYGDVEIAAGGARRRRLAQLPSGLDPIGIMGYFVIEGGDVADLQNVVSEFSDVGEAVDENGRPILSQRQVRSCEWQLCYESVIGVCTCELVKLLLLFGIRIRILQRWCFLAAWHAVLHGHFVCLTQRQLSAAGKTRNRA